MGPRAGLELRDRLINAPDTDPVELRACHDEAWGCAYSLVWRAYLAVIRDAACQRLRTASALLAKPLANGFSASESCADRHAPFPGNSHDHDTTVTYSSGSSPLIIFGRVFESHWA